MKLRKAIEDFLTANPASTQEAVVADCVDTIAVRSRRVVRVLERMTDSGYVVKTDDTYSMA